MGILKFALIDPVILSADSSGAKGIICTAGTSLSVESMGTASHLIKSEMAKHKTALFFRAKAIVADEMNHNGDLFSVEELVKGAQTFVGVPFYTNHQNDNIENARGKIIHSEWVPSEKAIYVVGFVDREAYPHICRGIEEDYMRGVSMGCSVEYSTCSICENRAATTDEYCFVPGTPILMEDCSVKNIEDVVIGDVVVDAFGKTTAVVNLFQHDVDEKVQTLFSRTTEGEITCTSNHPFLGFRRNEPVFIPAGLLEDKSDVYTPLLGGVDSVEIFNQCGVPEEKHNDFAKLIGYYAAEGNSTEGGLEFSLNANETNLIGDLTNLSISLFAVEPKIYQSSGNGISLRIHKNTLRDLLSKCITGTASTKKLNANMLHLPVSLLKAYIGAYIDGDGHCDDLGRIIVHSASRNLTSQNFHILLRLGVSPSVNSYDQDGGPSNREKVCRIYRLQIGNLQITPLADAGFKCQKSFTKTAERNPQSRLATTFDVPGFVRSCATLESNTYKGPVFNVETESGSYVANNISVHNCTHIRNRKGRRFSGTSKNVRTGEVRDFKDALVYENNHGIRFIELSGVGDPACKSCTIQGVFNTKEAMSTNQALQKAASIDNSLRMYRSSDLYKQASQADLDKVNQAETLIAELLTNLIANRANVEMEFAADFANILADLKKSIDELTAAGFGQLPDAPIPGVAGDAPADASAPPAGPEASGLPPAVPGAPAAGGVGAPQPVGQAAPAPVGSITGAPGAPALTQPVRPVAPKMGFADTNQNNLSKIGAQVEALRSILAGEKDDMRRRTPAAVMEQKRDVIQSLKEKTAGASNKETNLMSTDNSGGPSKMNATAARTDVSQVITEKQLADAKNIFHPRTGVEQDTITQDQLKAKREGTEQDVTHEGQLKGKQTGNVPNVTHEKQLAGERTGVEQEQITQTQLKSVRVDKEQEVTTEAQLENRSETGIWTRAAFSRTNLKTAAAHIDDVVDCLGRSCAYGKQSVADIISTASQLVDSVKAKTELLDIITDPAARQTNIVAASLKDLVASDAAVDPERVVYVLEALSEDKADAAKRVTASAKTYLAKITAAANKPSKAAEIRAALKPQAVSQAPVKKLAAKANHIIEASYKELGVAPSLRTSDVKAFRKAVVAFVNGVSASSGKRPTKGLEATAGVTNVDIEDNKIRIAISWDDEGAQSADLSLDPNADLGEMPGTPEGDMSGMEPAGSAAAPAAAPASALPAPAPAPAAGVGAPPPPATASARSGLKRFAQTPSGGGAGANAGAGGTPSGEQMPNMPPAMGDQPGLQSLTQDEAPVEENEEKPGQYPPGATCPLCGSQDVEVGKKDRAPGVNECNRCGLVYEMHFNLEILNPENLTVDKEKKGKIEEPEEPSLPSMPVAASFKLDQHSLVKIAECENKLGDVCPGCGRDGCKPTVKVAGHVEYTCPSCGTAATKDVLVNAANPKESQMRIAWVVDPQNQALGCANCSEESKRFAASLSVERMMKQAASSQRTTPFPKANCLERIARKWGANAIVMNGPEKGKPLAECVCKELEALGFTSVTKMRKLAEVYMQEDAMDECIRKQTALFAKRVKDVKVASAMACDACNSLKRKYANKTNTNLLRLAWKDEGLSAYALDAMDDALHGVPSVEAPLPVAADEGDLSDALPEAPKEVTITIPQATAENIAEQVADQTAPEAPAAEAPGVEGGPAAPVAPEAPIAPAGSAVTANTKENTMQKEAATPTQIKTIEKDVAAGVPRKEQLLGKEGEAESMINKTPQTPSIPRSDAKMGNEGKNEGSFIAKPNTMPDVPTQGAASLIGGEKGTLNGDVNTEVKGTVIAGTIQPIRQANDLHLQKEATKPTLVEHIDKGNATIPSGKATLGKEGPENIDVKMSEPKIPTGDAKMGEESKVDGGLNTPNTLPEIPTGDAKMGDEANTQKGLPADNTQIKGTVIAERKQTQLDRIASARAKSAMVIAKRLFMAGRIQENEIDQAFDDLKDQAIDVQERWASRIGAMQKVASTQPVNAPAAPVALPVLTSAVIQPSVPEAPTATDARQDLISTLAGAFTIGSRDLDKELRHRGER